MKPTLLLFCYSIGYATGFSAIINPAHAASPSFDCTKATTRAEKAICQDTQLGDLDATLLATLKAALERNPAVRDKLLLEERQWVRERDRSCVSLKGTSPSTDITACLRDAYQKRIEVLRLAQSQAVAEAPGDTSEAVCHKIVDRYKALLEADPDAPFRNDFEYAISPLELLAQTKSSGLKLEAELPMEGFDKNPEQIVKEWVEKQTHISAISKELSAALAEFATPLESPHFSFSPGMGLFRISSVGGTLGCNSNIFFSVESGRGQLAHEPDKWTDRDGGSGCGFSESLGTVDGTPFAFDYADSSGSSRIAVHGWDGEKFKAVCGVNFEFLPRFSLHPASHETDESCKRADCDALRQAALHLVEFVNSNQTDAQKQLTENLLPSQLKDFEILKEKSKVAHKETDEATNSQMTDLDPLLLPFLFENHLYLARVGHFTRGLSVTEPDWSVILEQRDKDTVSQVASFAIGMTNGKLLKADVQ